MFNQNNILYIGKARNLKKRVSSYFQKTMANARLAALVRQIDRIEVIVTHNENEALLLENQLIKRLKPKYNILLRDDKSYPFIMLSSHEYPRLGFYRLTKNSPKTAENLFGPYPSSLAVRETIKLLQKIFKLRSCRDSFFKHRIRPCLLYQIKKCSAPCTGLITKENYQSDIKNARLLLQGKNQEVINHLVLKMQQASDNRAYESAGRLRDQIAYLRHIQTLQVIKTRKENNIDVFAVVVRQDITAIGLLSIREGCISGSQTFYPDLSTEIKHTPAEILSAFISQYYLNNNTYNISIILKQKCTDHIFLQNALQIKIAAAQKAEHSKWIVMAEKTAEQAMKSLLLESRYYKKQFVLLQVHLSSENSISTIICFDISHTFGESTVGSCVVFNQGGFQKKFYRRFNIKNIIAGDDYSAMAQALERYFENAVSKVKEGNTANILPDILLIDGGKGQLHEAEKIVEKLNISQIKAVKILSIAKGAGRKSGLEKIFVSGGKHPLDIAPDSSVFHLLQKIRDEAHRFAISTHRKQRAKTRRTSVLEKISGIGPKKRQALLQYLGGFQEIKKASVEQLSAAPGIQKSLAEKIYALLHEE